MRGVNGVLRDAAVPLVPVGLMAYAGAFETEPAPCVPAMRQCVGRNSNSCETPTFVRVVDLNVSERVDHGVVMPTADNRVGADVAVTLSALAGRAVTERYNS